MGIYLKMLSINMQKNNRVYIEGEYQICSISRAEIIDIKSMSGDDIKFGATVEIEDDDTEKTKYQIMVNLNLT